MKYFFTIEFFIYILPEIFAIFVFQAYFATFIYGDDIALPANKTVSWAGLILPNTVRTWDSGSEQREGGKEEDQECLAFHPLLWND